MGGHEGMDEAKSNEMILISSLVMQITESPVCYITIAFTQTEETQLRSYVTVRLLCNVKRNARKTSVHRARCLSMYNFVTHSNICA